MVLTVLVTDDPNLPVVTFRTWVLGIFPLHLPLLRQPVLRLKEGAHLLHFRTNPDRFGAPSLMSGYNCNRVPILTIKLLLYCFPS